MSIRHLVIVLALLAMLVPLGSLSLGIGAGPAPLVVASTTAGLPTATDAARGQRLYASTCAGCHAPEANFAPPHNTADFRVRYPTDESIATVVRSGRHPMPAFTPRDLSGQDLADLISYIRTLK